MEYLSGITLLLLIVIGVIYHEEIYDLMLFIYVKYFG